MSRYEIGGAKVLLHLKFDGSRRIATSSDADIVASCSYFAELRAHASRLSRSAEEAAVLLARLNALANEGLLLSDRQLFETASERRNVETGTQPITWLTIPTRDRPSALERCVSSYTRNIQRWQRRPRLFISDGSSGDTESALVEVLGRIVSERHVPVEYAGIREKESYLSGLAKDEGIPEDVLKFGLLGCVPRLPSYGANRNAILLQTVGELALSADDDTICETGTTGIDQTFSLKFGNDIDCVESWFASDRADALRLLHGHDIDIIGAHQTLLGKSISVLAGQASREGRLDPSGGCDHLLLSLYSGSGSIAVTMNGVAGHCGAQSSAFHLLTDRRSTRNRMLRSERAFHLAMTSKEGVRQVTAPTVAHSNGMMSMVFGFDNRHLLPPFIPVCRGEDMLFGYTLRMIDGESYFGHIPWTVVHAPIDRRLPQVPRPPRASLPDIVTACMASYSLNSCYTERSQRLRSIGQHLVDLGSLPCNELAERVQPLLWSAAEMRARRETAILERFGYYPEFWAETVQRRASRRRVAVASETYLQPYDIWDRFDDREAPGILSYIIRSYGRLLYWWPDIYQSARRRSASGVRLGRLLKT